MTPGYSVCSKTITMEGLTLAAITVAGKHILMLIVDGWT